jgi:hypothetical protein
MEFRPPPCRSEIKDRLRIDPWKVVIRLLRVSPVLPNVVDADDPHLEIDLEENAEGRSKEDQILVSPRFAGTERVVS